MPKDAPAAYWTTLENLPGFSSECRLLLEHVRDIVMFVGIEDGCILFANRAAVETYGYSLAELTGMCIEDLLLRKGDELNALVDTTRGGTVTEDGTLFEVVHRRKDGSTLAVEVNARIASFVGSRMIIAVIRDVTERKSAETALRAAYDEITQVFETAADGMRIVDRDFLQIRVNHTFADMANIDFDTAVGMTCFDAFPGDACGTPDCTLVRVLDGEAKIVTEVDKHSHDGVNMACMVTAQPFVVNGETVGMIEDFRDVTERKHAEALAQHLATHDALTGLPNRLLLTDRLELAIARAEREGMGLALMFCDLDNLKAVNDVLGHAAGDTMLVSAAHAMRSAVRKVDTVARVGGDEYVVLLEDLQGPDDAKMIAAKMLEAVRDSTRVVAAAVRGSISIGIAVYSAGDDANALMHRADAVMYRVKESGGDAFRVAGS